MSVYLPIGFVCILTVKSLEFKVKADTRRQKRKTRKKKKICAKKMDQPNENSDGKKNESGPGEGTSKIHLS